MTDQRSLLLAALGFLQLQPMQPELATLHTWLDTWGWRGSDHRGHGSSGARPPARELLRPRLASELLPGGDCSLHRGGLRRGADAVEGRAARRLAGAQPEAAWHVNQWLG